MAITVNWSTKVIFIPQSDLVLISGVLYELDIDVFRLTLRNLEDNSDGMSFDQTHSHNTTVTVGGVTLARVVEIINGYTITFEDGQYAVLLTGANSNISDVVNVNQVSIRSQNSAGLVQVVSGSGLSTEQDSQLKLILSATAGKAVISSDGLTIQLLAEDGVTILRTLDVSANGLDRTPQ